MKIRVWFGYGDKPFLRMNSNAYLGLSLQEELIRAEEAAVRAFGTGPGAVRFISGTYQPHIALEEKLARFHNREAAMIFSSAYAAVMGVISPLIEADTIVLSDELNHNCIINGIRLSRAKEKIVYKHNDPEAIRTALEACALGVPVLANARCKVLMGQCLRSNGGLFYHGYAEFAEALRQHNALAAAAAADIEGIPAALQCRMIQQGLADGAQQARHRVIVPGPAPAGLTVPVFKLFRVAHRVAPVSRFPVSDIPGAAIVDQYHVFLDLTSATMTAIMAYPRQ